MLHGGGKRLAGAWIASGTLLAAACAPTEPAAASHSSVAAATTPPASHVAPTLPSPGSAGSARISASAPAAAAPSASGPRAPRRYVLAAIGDSLTDPKSHGGKYLDVLRERCPKSSFTSFGKGGNMVNMMRKRFLRDVYGEGEAGDAPKSAPPRYTHVLILGGLGDIGSNETAGRNADKIEKDILEMVEMSRKRGAQAVVLTIPPWKGHGWYNPVRAQMARDVNERIVSAARAKRIDGFFDTRPSLSCGNPERLCEGLGWADDIHWSEKGHRAMGEALHAAMFSDCE